MSITHTTPQNEAAADEILSEEALALSLIHI